MKAEQAIPGFLFGFKIDEAGRAEPLPPGICDGSSQDGSWVWIALDRTETQARDWLKGAAQLNGNVVEALVEEDSRPRCLVTQQGALLILRGINLNPRADPTDLVSVRVWIEDDRIITLQHRKLQTVDDLRAQFEHDRGPKSSAELVVALAHGLLERMREVIERCQAEMDKLEDESHTGRVNQLRRRLIDIRHDIVPLRRYIAPQRDALSSLTKARLDWLDDWWRSHLQELNEDASRYVEDLDAIRESATIVHDTLSARMQEQTNRTIAMLSVGAAFFLPMTLFVGLLGANVEGIPFSSHPYAFWGATGVLILIGLIEYAIFIRLRLNRFFW